LLGDIVMTSRTLNSKIDLSSAVSRAEVQGALSTEDWLLAYEYRINKWCKPAAWDRVDAWKELKTANVRFLVPKVRRGLLRLRRRRPAFLLAWRYM
jgi:hypothetical protein